MGFFDPVVNQLKVVRQLTPKNLNRLARMQLTDLIEREAIRAQPRVDELRQRFPSAGERELSQRFVDSKKQLAGMVGGISGVFGVATVPLDLVGMAYLQIALLAEVGTVFKADLKSERGRQELLELFGYSNGIGPMQRAGPRVVGSLAGVLLRRGGLTVLGRAMPLVAAPISAYLNNQHIQRIGDAAVRHYDGWVHAEEKKKKASGE